jgi:dihydrofolate reductase
MRKIILIAHVSLDGFVAGLKGELDGFEPGEENLEFVCKIAEEADAAIFGRVSYQLLDSYWPTAHDRPNATRSEINYSNWYNAANKIVLSRTLSESDSHNTNILGANISEEINKIKQQPGKDILMFGSPAAYNSLLQLDLIDGYWIFINPVIFGEGIPLFTKRNERTKLRLLNTKEFPNGELALNYTLDR